MFLAIISLLIYCSNMYCCHDCIRNTHLRFQKVEAKKSIYAIVIALLINRIIRYCTLGE